MAAPDDAAAGVHSRIAVCLYAIKDANTAPGRLDLGAFVRTPGALPTVRLAV